MTETVATALSREISSQPGFKQLLTRFEMVAASRLVGADLDASSVNNADLRIAARYADILSHSSDSSHREVSLRLLTHLVDHVSQLDSDLAAQILSTSEAVLVQLGNFPGVATLNRGRTGETILPDERELTRALKTARNRTPSGDRVLTDAQANIFEAVRNADIFSFSGPTSLGKSFLIRELIKDALSNGKQGMSVVVVVPSVALMSQVVADLRTELANDVAVMSHPVAPKIIRQRARAVILVLTPERLLRYLASNPASLDWLYVDEAHKAVQDGDERSPLYYQAISEAIARLAPKVGFSSPNVANPDVYEQVFDVQGTSIHASERVVLQRRLFVDLVDGHATIFGLPESDGLTVPYSSSESASEFVTRVSAGDKTIVYINSASLAVEFARETASHRARLDSPSVTEARASLRANIHRDYYLRETLSRGVAFHHGVMPSEVRELVESVFSDVNSGVNIIVCTSTLLEGVNLPAKNIVVLHEKQGNRVLRPLDFNNLVGRAGRLAREFYGNVICLRHEEKRWKSKATNLIGDTGAQDVSPFVLDRSKKKQHFTDMADVLSGKTGHWTSSRKALARRYASVLATQRMEGASSVLLDAFLRKVPNGADILNAVVDENVVPASVLKGAPEISISYQQRLHAGFQEPRQAARLVPNDADLGRLETYYQILHTLGEVYNWEVEERAGQAPLIRGKSADAIDRNYWYWARIMRSWVLGEPVGQVIRAAIRYHRETGRILIRDWDSPTLFREEIFDSKSRIHTNLIIEDTFRDLDGGLRHTILRYAQNYFDVSSAVLGTAEAGTNVAVLVEYGSADLLAIQLQQLGLARASAIEIARAPLDIFVFDDDGDLIGVEINDVGIVDQLSTGALEDLAALIRLLDALNT